VVSNPDVSNPVYVRYAWSDSSSGTLFNKEGLPAATFTSER
jgi:sialate O-acetylesterase